MVETSPSAPLKSTVEPIPRTSAGKSLSVLLPKHRWDRIRKRVYAEHGHRCAVCGAERRKGSLHCHEEWEYDDATGVQRLKGFVALCRVCHSVKHGTPEAFWVSFRFREYGPGVLSKMLEEIANGREELLRRRLLDEELAKPYEHRRRELFNAEAYRKELSERDEESRRWLEEVDRKRTIEHFVEVNRPAPLAVLEEHIVEATKTQAERSRREWRIDFGEFHQIPSWSGD